MPYALVYGANRSGSAVSWLTGWPVTREALLVVAPEEDDVVTRDGHAGVQTGELLLVTEHGPQRLHAYPQGLQQAG